MKRMIERENGHIAHSVKRKTEKQKGDEGNEMKEKTSREMGYKLKGRTRTAATKLAGRLGHCRRSPLSSRIELRREQVAIAAVTMHLTD